MDRIRPYSMPFIGNFQGKHRVFPHVIQLDPESIGYPELKRFANISYRYTVPASSNADVTVRADDPLLKLSDPVMRPGKG